MIGRSLILILLQMLLCGQRKQLQTLGTSLIFLETKRFLKDNNSPSTILRSCSSLNKTKVTAVEPTAESGYSRIAFCCVLFLLVQSPISTYPGLTLNKTYRVNRGLAQIGLWFEKLTSMITLFNKRLIVQHQLTVWHELQ